MAKKMNNNYDGRNYASDVNAVKKSTLLKTEGSSMILRPVMIGSYYKNNKQIRNIAYWTKVLEEQDAEKLAMLKQA